MTVDIPLQRRNKKLKTKLFIQLEPKVEINVDNFFFIEYRSKGAEREKTNIPKQKKQQQKKEQTSRKYIKTIIQI